MKIISFHILKLIKDIIRRMMAESTGRKVIGIWTLALDKHKNSLAFIELVSFVPS